ncbi:uncharacterized protein GLRG_00350 [Colletotrichum graminicola M1.001]|uniref:Uncharacterized protein n=1 Tax=Colletotrichum graminicola (strain M1.001 / M2 / FGSC 10212) TaxID=645133 RepID=E3Q2A5_COLGM|nr:uncharacterized protein GLRG_00350 [Colletotrichum graminicola M1.001]EFQ25206.1 hypothetical protein GLRG_00350 [Colletotrichum graminicola M1.001]
MATRSTRWVEFGEKVNQVTCTDSVATCTRTKYVYKGCLLPADSIMVANPKDIISQASPGSNKLRFTLASMLFQMKLSIWDSVNDEVISLINMPMSLTQEAVESMEHVAAIGEEPAKEGKKELILTILSVMFLVIAFAGETLDEANLSKIGTIFKKKADVIQNIIHKHSNQSVH